MWPILPGCVKSISLNVSTISLYTSGWIRRNLRTSLLELLWSLFRHAKNVCWGCVVLSLLGYTNASFLCSSTVFNIYSNILVAGGRCLCCSLYDDSDPTKDICDWNVFWLICLSVQNNCCDEIDHFVSLFKYWWDERTLLNDSRVMILIVMSFDCLWFNFNKFN